MTNSTDKPEIRDPAYQTQKGLIALDPNTGLGSLLDEKTLDAISAGDDATLTEREPDYKSSDLYRKRRQDLRDAYRDKNPSAHPDDVEKMLDNNHFVPGYQG